MNSFEKPNPIVHFTCEWKSTSKEQVDGYRRTIKLTSGFMNEAQGEGERFCTFII